MAFTAQQLARQLRELHAEQRIICVHPNFRPQNLVLNAVWSESAYVRLDERDVAGDVEAQILAALHGQVSSARADGSGEGYLVLDEADRAQPDVLVRLLRRVLREQAGTRVILLSRRLLDVLLAEADLRQQTIFFPSDPDQMLWDYARQEAETLLEVRAFGEGRVHLNGRRVESWDGALPRALFFYLIDRGMVTRAEIFETFWPNLTTREATNVFHVTKRKISEVLKTELTVYGSGFYHISPRIQLSYDVSLFNQALQESDSSDSGGAALRAALELYRGDYLAALNAEWVQRRRDALRQAACDALVTLGKVYEAAGSPQEALGCFLRASRLRPEREDSAFASMRLYRDLGLPEDALRVYRLLEQMLRRNLNVAPSPQIQHLAAQIAP